MFIIPGVMSLLNDDESDAWLVVGLQLDAGFSNGSQLMLQDLEEHTA